MWIAMACIPDDWNGEPYVPATSDPPPADTAPPSVDDPTLLVGAWRSEGGDLAPLLAGPPFEYTRVDATFEDDGSYLVVSTDLDGAQFELSGTFTTTDDTTPGIVVLSQEVPYEAEASGIWEVASGVLTYEVVQTQPNYGFVPPTPASGFGTTTGPGITDDSNIQIYRTLQ